MDLSLGCRLPTATWTDLNRTRVFDDPSLRPYVAPFPPPELMTAVSGLASERDFAAHGAHFFERLTEAAGRPLAEFPSLLDFGVGVGRLMRMLKGHPGKVHGCDIDPRSVAWMQSNIDYCETRLSHVVPPLPYGDAEFDAVVSISVFTHLNESSQHAFLQELARVTRPGATLMLTIHGDSALRRARTEENIFRMISVDTPSFERAIAQHDAGQHAFILQAGHLTRRPGEESSSILKDEYEYGITFIPKPYIQGTWGRYFKVRRIVDGGLHGFQDIVVLER